MLGDLHFHSTDSDGKYDNTHIIGQIQALDPKNQGIWAITNHDCYSPGFVLQAREVGINAVWATEISAHSNELDSSLHVTCYTSVLSESIKRLIDGVLRGKREKVRKQVSLLSSHGFPIDTDGFLAWTDIRGYRPTHLSNAQICEFLFAPEQSAETLRVLVDHTNGSITRSSQFLVECLKETGDYRHLGAVEIPPYEPELSELMQIGTKEDIVLSIAHPNFSFHPIYKRAGVNADANMRWDHFYSDILPALDEMGVRNYEINAMTPPKQAAAIHTIVQQRNGLVSYASDNHGKSKTDAKHGLLGVQNAYLTHEICRPIREKLIGFLS